MTRKPLEGITVADFSHVMAGPYASHILRLLGATVIKIEPPGVGDLMRNYGEDRSLDGMAPGFVAVNAGKKSVVLNLKDSDGREAAHRIVATADVVLENFRPGVMARFGLDYETVQAFAPQVVYCSVSGYGQSGPLRDWPAIDNIVQATSGMMSVSGEEGDPPVRVGFPIVDTLTGQTAAMAIMAGLLRRGASGEGEYIDVSMLDSSLAFMTSVMVPYMMTGKKMERKGNTGYSGQPTSAVYTARDGQLVSLGIVQQHQFRKFAELVGRLDWFDDPRFATLDERRLNFDAMKREVEAVLITRDGADWEKTLSDAGVPCGLVRDASQVVDIEQIKGRSIMQKVPLHGVADADQTQILSSGFEMSKGSPGVDEAPPLLGEHNEDVLSKLGLDAATVVRLCNHATPPKNQAVSGQ